MNGSLFAFAEGAESLKLFWARDGKHFVRPLTWDETQEFCRLARTRPFWPGTAWGHQPPVFANLADFLRAPLTSCV